MCSALATKNKRGGKLTLRIIAKAGLFKKGSA